jgi:hypothetical protein
MKLRTKRAKGIFIVKETNGRFIDTVTVWKNLSKMAT